MISTGLTDLDDILDGGIKEGIITDVYGSSGTGKSQMLMQIAVNSISNGKTVLFQDTTNNFRPERIHEILDSNNLDSRLLENIHVLRVTNTSEQVSCISSIEDFDLIVIDNITDLFTFEYNKKPQYWKKNILLLNYMHDLSSLAIKKNIPIIISNITQIIDDKEIENFANSLNLFTHVKIKLSRLNTSYFGHVESLSTSNYFTYRILASGLAQKY